MPIQIIYLDNNNTNIVLLYTVLQSANVEVSITLSQKSRDYGF